MGRTERITVAETTAGKGASGPRGRTVSLPVVELLTGRGFVTGKSGSGKSNTASVVAEELLASGFGLLIVDVDGEYYGLKEDYEILHAGADEGCDVQVDADHAEKLASLALERNVPVILDVSGYLDEDEADGVLAAVARHLFARAKKQKQPFLVLVEEVHEYIPENGSVGEAGKLLIKIGKRGRKHGLGICGISQRPADVKKDFITQCDWLVWHRLTWNNDTKVVRRMLDGEYASAVEDLADGEGFLVTDWSDRIHRVQFYRKRTFDAGATPGLGEVRRPDLKSVSDDLVAELASVSEEQQARDDRIEELREELDRKNSRIAELEAELQDARDLSRMAEQFVDALVDHVDGPAPGRTERERQRQRRRRRSPNEQSAGARAESRSGRRTDSTGPDRREPSSADDGETVDEDAMAAFGAMMDADDGESTGTGDTTESRSNGRDDDADLVDLSALAGLDSTASSNGLDSTGDGRTSDSPRCERSSRTAADGGLAVRSFSTEVADFERGARDPPSLRTADDGSTPTGDRRPAPVCRLDESFAGLDERSRAMLEHYREEGPTTPAATLLTATGREDRNEAYARNRSLRMAGLIEHVGRGYYDYSLRETLDAALDDDERDERTVDYYARDLEQEYLE